MWRWWLVTTTFKVVVTVTTTFSLYFGEENRIFLGTRSVLWIKICRKCNSGRGCAPDSAGGAHNAPPDPLVGWGADTPPHTPPHSAPLVSRCSRLRCLSHCAPWHQILATPLVTTTFKGKVVPVLTQVVLEKRPLNGCSSSCSELPGWAGTRKVNPIWILLKQEAVASAGPYASLHLAPDR